jgi:hypothetical protein
MIDNDYEREYNAEHCACDGVGMCSEHVAEMLEALSVARAEPLRRRCARHG